LEAPAAVQNARRDGVRAFHRDIHLQEQRPAAAVADSYVKAERRRHVHHPVALPSRLLDLCQQLGGRLDQGVREGCPRTRKKA